MSDDLWLAEELGMYNGPVSDECQHDSMSGDEGPVALLGRMPVRWRCDTCDAIVYDDVNIDGVETR